MTSLLELPAEMKPWQANHRGPIPSKAVRRWVMHMVALCLPDEVYWCSGDSAERRLLPAQHRRR